MFLAARANPFGDSNERGNEERGNVRNELKLVERSNADKNRPAENINFSKV